MCSLIYFELRKNVRLYDNLYVFKYFFSKRSIFEIEIIVKRCLYMQMKAFTNKHFIHEFKSLTGLVGI